MRRIIIYIVNRCFTHIKIKLFLFIICVLCQTQICSILFLLCAVAGGTFYYYLFAPQFHPPKTVYIYVCLLYTSYIPQFSTINQYFSMYFFDCIIFHLNLSNPNIFLSFQLYQGSICLLYTSRCV